MIDSTALVAALKAKVLDLEEDLRTRVDAQPEVSERWRAEHRRVLAAERTASSWTEWRDDRVTQAAVAWVLTTVFVRFSEDNGLVKPVWISGPGSRRQEALDAQLAFFRGQPEATDREWVLEAVSYLQRLPSTAGLVDDHSPLWSVSPSGQAVTDLLAFWRERDADDGLRWDFADPAWSTRFLGDLYQDLSEHAKKTYALLQTPEFVEEFILDQTLQPALMERRLDGFSMIDPTCGSGHFLLGAFARLLVRWETEAPGLELQERVQKALDAVHGVDLNPFAVAIARFRLTVAALLACELRALEQAPAFKYHLAAGDSLLFGRLQEALPFAGADEDETMRAMVQSSEDLSLLKSLLAPGGYDVVVGNPPYIRCEDPQLRSQYRARYPEVCIEQWVLAVPFVQRFFELAKHSATSGLSGRVGQITSNSFMKRDFGKNLIEKYLAGVDLTLIADVSGINIPGHQTPPVILVGTAQAPVSASVLVASRVARELKGARPPGPAWMSILKHVEGRGGSDEWISVKSIPRESLRSHPWRLIGDDISAGLSQIEARSNGTLGSHALRIGLFGDSHADEAFLLPAHVLKRLAVAPEFRPPVVRGEHLRDWGFSTKEAALLPYRHATLVDVGELSDRATRLLWRVRTPLWARASFAGGMYKDHKTPWYGWHQLPADRGAGDLLISYAFKTSQLHACMTNSRVAFNRNAPIIRFASGVPSEQILVALGMMNSSMGTFWARQNAQHQGGGASDKAWKWTFEFAGKIVARMPLPSTINHELVVDLDRLAWERRRAMSAADFLHAADSGSVKDASDRTDQIPTMVYLQEELDWDLYYRFGLIGAGYSHASGPVPINPGQRAFALEASVSGDESEADGSAEVGLSGVEYQKLIPASWPHGYAKIVRERLNLIKRDPFIAILESSEFKREWITWSGDSQLGEMQDWLLARLEDRQYWFQGPTPTPRSISQLADAVGRDEDLVAVLSLWEGRPDVSVVQSLTKLLTEQAVPFLAAYRLKDSGLRTFQAWQETWDLQRQEDAGKDVGVIPVPPKYTSADFRKPSWWQARGKLDVPKERFILYPSAGRATDSTLLLGWAGWDHAEQALALATIIGERETEGRSDEDLVPLVAGLAELQPWVEQWHADVHPVYGQSLAVFCREQLADRSRQVNRSSEQLAAWRPPAATRGRKAKA